MTHIKVPNQPVVSDFPELYCDQVLSGINYYESYKQGMELDPDTCPECLRIRKEVIAEGLWSNLYKQGLPLPKAPEILSALILALREAGIIAS